MKTLAKWQLWILAAISVSLGFALVIEVTEVNRCHRLMRNLSRDAAEALSLREENALLLTRNAENSNRKPRVVESRRIDRVRSEIRATVPRDYTDDEILAAVCKLAAHQQRRRDDASVRVFAYYEGDNIHAQYSGAVCECGPDDRWLLKPDEGSLTLRVKIATANDREIAAFVRTHPEAAPLE
jgi:hypothetical protein